MKRAVKSAPLVDTQNVNRLKQTQIMQVGSLVEAQIDFDFIGIKEKDILTVIDIQKFSLETIKHNNTVDKGDLSEVDMKTILQVVGTDATVLMFAEIRNVYVALENMVTHKPNFIEIQQPIEINVDEITEEIEEPCMI